MTAARSFDKMFLGIVAALVILGFFIFSSASLGLVARDGSSLASLAGKQVLIGVVGGAIALAVFSQIHYSFWKKYATWIFILTLIVTALVFVPGLGFATGGAHRWIRLGPLMFQPSEILKLGYVLFLATMFTRRPRAAETVKEGLLPFLGALLAVGLLLLKQPDTGTFMVFVFTGAGMYFVAGGQWKHFFALGAVGLAGIALLFATRPYVRERILTFIDPSRDAQGSSYQIQQALIAIGSGKIGGRGFGQSIQKFKYLPEPVGDSIFAVTAEEFGLIGSTVLILLFLLFALRGMRIATHAPDSFSALLAVGIVIHIVSQSAINIAAMLGLIPLTGVPLMFISQGGTALFIGLCEIGILLNISQHAKRHALAEATA
ncbi:MAG: putative lipid II flippase FtsW [Patescibacteria group bacterium]